MNLHHIKPLRGPSTRISIQSNPTTEALPTVKLLPSIATSDLHLVKEIFIPSSMFIISYYKYLFIVIV